MRACAVWELQERSTVSEDVCPVSRADQGRYHTHPFNGPLSGTTRVSGYQKGKTDLDFTEARDDEWHWHQLDHMQVCIPLQTDNHAGTPSLSFLQAGCPSCRQPTASKHCIISYHKFIVRPLLRGPRPQMHYKKSAKMLKHQENTKKNQQILKA